MWLMSERLLPQERQREQTINEYKEDTFLKKSRSYWKQPQNDIPDDRF